MDLPHRFSHGAKNKRKLSVHIYQIIPIQQAGLFLPYIPADELHMLPVPLMHLRLKDQIHHVSCLAGALFPYAPENSVHQTAVSGNLALEVPSVSPHMPGCFHKGMVHGKERFGIICTAGF